MQLIRIYTKVDSRTCRPERAVARREDAAKVARWDNDRGDTSARVELRNDRRRIRAEVAAAFRMWAPAAST